MKLVLCPHCHDVFKLAKNVRFCACKKSGGQYKEDGLNAVYWGGIPLGFANSTLVDAVENQPEEGAGREFVAFVIPKKCPTMKVLGEA